MPTSERSVIPELGLPLAFGGKVREAYELDNDRLVFVTSDRISAFDVVMNETINNKGRILTAMTDFWFNELEDLIPSHEARYNADELPEAMNHPYYQGRTTVADRLEMLPIECIVRGYLTGSAWKEYKTSGTVHGMDVPVGLVASDKFPEPLFTPSTKAELGQHDVNISIGEAGEIVGKGVIKDLQRIAVKAYVRMHDRASKQGIIIADTKFEIGTRKNGDLAIGDEVGTPDSSRFWPKRLWAPGSTPPSFDKQPLRDYLENLDWDKTPPPPQLLSEVVDATEALYQESYERVTGLELSSWPSGQKN